MAFEFPFFYTQSPEVNGGVEGSMEEGEAPKKGGERKGRRSNPTPATAEKLDSAMETYWGKTAEGMSEDKKVGDGEDNGDASAPEGEKMQSTVAQGEGAVEESVVG